MPKKSSGFTLIELLVAISIIAILSVVGFVSYQNVTAKAKDAKMKADIDAIKKAYETNYDPSANSGQGGYKALEDSQFASGKIPKQPNGDPYPCAVGPVGPDSTCTDNSTQGYHVATILSNGTYYAAVSTQGTLAGSGTLSSCVRNGLVGYWKMDDGSWNVNVAGEVKDSSGNNNHGTASAGAANSTMYHTQPFPVNLSVAFGNAGNFSGGYINLPSLPAVRAPYTVVFWFNPAQLAPDGTKPILFLQGSSDFPIFTLNDSGGSRLLAYAGAEKYRYGSHTFASDDLNKWWQAVFIVADSSSLDNWKVYLNGVDDTGAAGGNSGSYYDPGISGMIGRAGGNYFKGMIDDVRIYNRALDPAEITALYNNGSGCI